jgi:two-component system, chemotaxis family, protein-glutamate methylesterase/glutaminase
MAAGRTIVAIGASAGGVEALTVVAAALPPDLAAPVLVTVHIGGNAESRLPSILTRSGPLPAVHARDGEPLRPGRIYVAPPDRHLLAAAGIARLSSGPRVNRHRPAVDVMFASAARWAGDGAVAVVLSGMLDDGAVGAALVARAGGRVVVQDPADAAFDAMPRAALFAVPDATVTSAVRLGTLVRDLAARPAALPTTWEGDSHGMPEGRMADGDDPAFLAPDEVRLTRMSCPECNGGLAEIELSGFRYYRCHVGHQYSPRSLEAEQRAAAEAKLWAAAAALEEHAAMARHLSRRSDEEVDEGLAADYHRVAEQSSTAARLLVEELHQRRDVERP